jgi:hypothetical protein
MGGEKLGEWRKKKGENEHRTSNSQRPTLNAERAKVNEQRQFNPRDAKTAEKEKDETDSSRRRYSSHNSAHLLTGSPADLP